MVVAVASTTGVNPGVRVLVTAENRCRRRDAGEGLPSRVANRKPRNGAHPMRPFHRLGALIALHVLFFFGGAASVYAGSPQDTHVLELDAISSEQVTAKIRWLQEQLAPWRSQLPMDPAELDQLVKHEVQLAILNDLATLQQRRTSLQTSIAEQEARIKDVAAAGGTRKQLDAMKDQLGEFREKRQRTGRLCLCSGADFERNKSGGTLVGWEGARLTVATSFHHYVDLLFREVDSSDARRNKTKKTDLQRFAEACEKTQARFAFNATRDDGRRAAQQNLALRQYYERCAATCRDAAQLATRGDVGGLNELLARSRAPWLGDLLDLPPGTQTSIAIDATDKGLVGVDAPEEADGTSATTQPRSEVPAITPLDIGMDAPALQVSGWVQGDPLAEFRDGTIYIVHLFNAEFAASLESSQMVPALEKLQRAYAGAGVVVVAVSCADKAPDSVFKFVAKQKGKLSYAVARDLRKDWTADPKSDPGFMVEHWINAATPKDERGKSRGGIGPYPLTFVVDAQGKIAYIGKPNGLENVVSLLLTRAWDTNEARFARRFEVLRGKVLKQAFEAAAGRGDRAEAAWFEMITAAMACDWDRAIDTSIRFRGECASSGNHAARAELLGLNRSIVELLSIAGRQREARSLAKEVIHGAANTDAQELAMLAFLLLDEELHRPATDDIELALRALDRARQLTADSNPWATSLAALAHFLKGDKQTAVQLQEQALARVRELGANESSKEFKDFLASQEAQLARFKE